MSSKYGINLGKVCFAMVRTELTTTASLFEQDRFIPAHLNKQLWLILFEPRQNKKLFGFEHTV